MIISADCIDNVDSNRQTTTRTKSVHKKKSKQSRSSTARTKLYKSTEFYTLAKKCNNLLATNQYINNNYAISWKYLLKQVLCLDYSDNLLPPNIILIAKLDLSAVKERERYSLICNEMDFLSQSKIATENKCSFSILVKYLKNQVFKKENKHKYISDILKPNSIFISITIFNANYCLGNNEDNIDSECTTKSMPHSTKENIKLDTIKGFVSAIQDNLSNLESYLGSSIAHDKHSDQIHVGFVCNRCKSNIIGIRYRCSVCSDFDLCEVCERLSDGFHDNSHVFLKIKNPLKFCPRSDELGGKEYANKLLDTFKYSPDKINVKALSANLANGQNDHIDQNSAQVNNSSTLKAQAGSKITKIWKIINNGNTTWTSQITLQCVSGNIDPLDGRFVLPVPLLKPGEDGIMAVSFQIPSNIKTITNYESVWHFYSNESSFGEPLYFNITATPIDSSDYSSKTMQLNDTEDECSSISDSSIKFPACFNLDVPFLNEKNLKLIGKKIDQLNHSDILNLRNMSSQEEVSDDSSKSVSEKFKLPVSHITKASHKSADKLKSNSKSPKKVNKVYESQTVNKNLDKSSELLIPVPSISSIKKIVAKNMDKSDPLIVPVPSVSSIKKIALKNGQNNVEVDNQDNDSTTSKVKKVREEVTSETQKDCNLLKTNHANLNRKAQNSSTSSKEPNSSKGPQLRTSFPSFANETISNICANIFSKSGPTNYKKQSNGSNDASNSNVLKNNALQKLFEMGFCNQTLNMQLLVKNNFDIHETIRELYFSIGNNFFPEKTLKSKNSKKPKPCFSADDSVD